MATAATLVVPPRADSHEDAEYYTATRNHWPADLEDNSGPGTGVGVMSSGVKVDHVLREVGPPLKTGEDVDKAQNREGDTHNEPQKPRVQPEAECQQNAPGHEQPNEGLQP